MKKKFFLRFSFPFIALFSCIGTAFLQENGSRRDREQMIEQRVRDLLKSVQNEVEAYNYYNFATIHFASTIPAIKNPDVSIKDKAEILFGVKDADPHLIGLNITDLQGNSYLVEGPMYNFSERAYFKNALKGRETVFGPIINKVTNVPTIFYGAPHYDTEGNLTNTFFLAAHGEHLSEICRRNAEGSSFRAIIVRRLTGLVIASEEKEDLLNRNFFDDVAESGVMEFQDISEKIAAGETGFHILKFPDGKKQAISYAPIASTDWAIVVKADFADFAREKSKIPVILFALALTALATTVSFFLAKDF